MLVGVVEALKSEGKQSSLMHWSGKVCWLDKMGKVVEAEKGAKPF